MNGLRKPTAFVAAALAGETAAVASAQPGQRNHTLFCASVALGQLVGGGLVDEQTVRDLLLAACMDHVRDGAFTAGQADATITSGLTRGKTQPRTRNPRRVA